MTTLGKAFSLDKRANNVMNFMIIYFVVITKYTHTHCTVQSHVQFYIAYLHPVRRLDAKQSKNMKHVNVKLTAKVLQHSLIPNALDCKNYVLTGLGC